MKYLENNVLCVYVKGSNCDKFCLKISIYDTIFQLCQKFHYISTIIDIKFLIKVLFIEYKQVVKTIFSTE